jgi:hypothetical protein
MPKLEAALFGYLSDDPGIAALVDDRIYPVRLPEGAVLPAIVWQRISAARTYTHDPFDETKAWTQARVQFSCWHWTALGAIELGEAVLTALSGYSGQMEGELIGAAMADFELDDYEAETRLYRRLVDFLISYEDEPVIAS